MLLKKATSFSRLLPLRQNSAGKGCASGDESETGHSETFEQEEGLDVLSKSFKENIVKLRRFEAAIKKQIDNNLTMALARYTSGGSDMGAILPMRKAHKNRPMLSRTSKARKRLQEMRRQLEDALVQECFFSISIKGHQSQMKEILNDLKQPHTSTMPSDEELLEELKQKVCSEEH